MDRTIVFYHGDCPDGFGGAYSAWKKFGDTVEYRGLSRDKPAPTDIEGAVLYFIDFCYDQPTMDRIVAEAKSVIVLDHHEGVRSVIESMPEYRYSEDKSGATVAWEYFHPGVPAPKLLQYVEDGDLYRHALPHAHQVLSYCYMQPFTFQDWEKLIPELEDPKRFAEIVAIGQAYTDHSVYLVQEIAKRAELVTFEGYTVYLASCSKFHASFVGHTLAKKKGPLALIATVKPDHLRVSMRGDGSVDLTKIAQKYGGNGHPNAAAFSIPLGEPVPWTRADESPRD